MSSPLVFFDTVVLRNFAVVGRLDILESLYSGTFRWTDAVMAEVEEAEFAEPKMGDILSAGWIPDPIVVPQAEFSDVLKVQQAVGSVLSEPLEHLGEAETIYVMETCFPDAIFVTDDRPAANMARQRKLSVQDTAAVMRASFAAKVTGCPGSYDVLGDMRRLDRLGVRVPADHSAVCP
jgi:predicted nucleic acid-binding protein